MLSKMSQPNNAGGGGGSTGAASGRRLPLTLGAGSTVSRLQQGAGSNGRSNSPQNGNNVANKKTEQPNATSGSAAALKKSSSSQQRSTLTSSSTSSSSKEEEKKNQNGVQKSTNGKEKGPQNGSSSSSVKDQKEPKTKEKVEKVEKIAEKKEAKDAIQKDSVKSTPAVAEAAPAPAATPSEPLNEDVVPVVENQTPPVPTTPTSERKSSRKAAGQQKSPSNKPSPTPKQKQSESPAPIQRQTDSPAASPQKQAPTTAQEDVEMEPLTVDASPIRNTGGNLNIQLPAATSTPGRSLFGFRSAKQINEVELAAQTSSTPATAPPRTFSQISGRRSIRPVNSFTPSKAGSYRCINNELDTSSCTNTSMNATVGSEIPNSSSFSFSFFGRGRKRERTPPPPLSGSQSANDLAQDVDMSPPKRARFELFSSLASPFSLLRSRFSKTTISTPTRLCLEQTPTDGDEDGEEVQNVSGIVIEEEEQQLNTSSVSCSEELTVGQEAGLETPKKGGTPLKEVVQNEKKGELSAEDEADKEDENYLPAKEPIEVPVGAETEPNRSRCSIM